MKTRYAKWLVALALPAAALAPSMAAEPIRIALIDPLSGPAAAVGETNVKNFQFLLDRINARGGVLGGRKFELVTFDNKFSPQETLVQLKNVTDQKIGFMMQGVASSITNALIEAVGKHNERRADARVLYLNYATADPDFTNGRCSFWHFRFAANNDMKVEALTNHLRDTPKVKKVYIVGTDFPSSHDLIRATKEAIQKKRPDIQILGTELHPLLKVRDFTPYVTKIKASGADTILTSNFGSDLTLLVKAGKEIGLDATYYTYYAGGGGAPAAIGEGGVGKVKMLSEWHNNAHSDRMEATYVAYKKKYPDPKDEFVLAQGENMLEMLVAGIEKAKSVDPRAVAVALEDMKHAGVTGEVLMRKQDHQLLQPLYLSTMQKAAGNLKHDIEGSGFGFKTDTIVDAKSTALASICNMKRPAD